MNGTWQVVGGIALPDCILVGSDGDPNGVVRIPRSQGKYPAGGSYTLEEAYKLNTSTTITHLCHSIYQAPRPGGDAPVVFGFGPDIVEGTSRVLVTFNGYDFREAWADPLTTPAGRGVQMALGPTARGNLVLNSNDARYGTEMTRWRGPFPAAY